VKLKRLKREMGAEDRAEKPETPPEQEEVPTEEPEEDNPSNEREENE
jgi:hypothetical protein